MHQRGSAQCLLYRWVAAWAWLRGERLCVLARHGWSQRTGAACQLHVPTAWLHVPLSAQLWAAAGTPPSPWSSVQHAAALPLLHLAAEAEAKRLPAAVFRCKFPSLAAEQ